MQVRLARTDELGEARLAGVRLLMDAAFPDDFDQTDWDHALGGTHALVEEGDRVVAHGSVVWRELLVDDRPVRTAYVEAVAVAPDRRRRGLAAAVMAALEERARAEGAELLALGSSDQGMPLYLARGWVPWPGPTGVRSPSGGGSWEPTPDDDGAVLVLAGTRPVPAGTRLVCDPRPGDVW
ncbi:aminoglycoside 2'-N-acetyltransferase I [Nocardioides scoriae]|uniref:Aminoglycoside 2'-N-acetyltransferase I n=1 Tax=Nocardioides scoriae TaxID=642780 RepID=A0A1H1RYS6_9ACTN|nr:GNAT family N-acetyltransferase [Nocardioides scoriae]SDS40833.1 aminoglycoside 2'-N-acetyltransferase I [Nocardioides scoriae]